MKTYVNLIYSCSTQVGGLYGEKTVYHLISNYLKISGQGYEQGHKVKNSHFKSFVYSVKTKFFGFQGDLRKNR